MEQRPALLSSAITAPSKGKIFAGLFIMVGWIMVHVVLFYLFVVSGFLVEIALGFIKSILFNDQHAFSSMDLVWEGTLRTGLIIAGAAGIPLGLSKFWFTHQKRLKKAFWLTLLIGILFELYAVYILVTTAFS